MKDLRCRIAYTTKEEKLLLQEYIKTLKLNIRDIGVKEALSRMQPQSSQIEAEKVVKEQKPNNLSYQIDGTNIRTIEELMERHQIDPLQWTYTSFRVSEWQQKENGELLYSIRANFKKVDDIYAAKYLDDLRKGLYDYKAPAKIKRTTESGYYCGIINIYDAHIDKMTVLNETGTESDIYKNVELFEQHFDNLLSYLGSPEKIIFPVGNDFFNVNDGGNATKKGTHQPTYISHIDAYKIGLNLIRRCIDKARKIAPVIVPIIQGNHDEDIISILGGSLDVIYSDAEDVEIIDNRIQRKYISYGQNLFMFDHGDKVKIDRVPAIMMHERPQEYANSSFRYCFRGHCHHRQSHKILSVKELVDVEVHHLRALSQPSNWNVQAGWIGSQKSTTAYKITLDGKHFESKVLTL